MDPISGSRCNKPAAVTTNSCSVKSQNGCKNLIYGGHVSTSHGNDMSPFQANQLWDVHREFFFAQSEIDDHLQTLYNRHEIVTWSGYYLLCNSMALMFGVAKTYSDDIIWC